MVTTRNFRDVEIRRGTRDDLWDEGEYVIRPIFAAVIRFEVTERVDSGEVVEALDEDDVAKVACILKRREVETVAVVHQRVRRYRSRSGARRRSGEELDGQHYHPPPRCCWRSSST